MKHEGVQGYVESVGMEKLEMEEEVRKTGIDVIGDAPWGTHFCQFYETKEDLIDVLVPYFKAGLENNEFCMWVTSEPLSEEEAKGAMREAVPDFDRYLKRGQMEIVPHAEWYLKDGVFNLHRVLNAWIDKLDQALAKGYDGIRVTGNTAWLEKRDWRSFVDYEEEVNSVIGMYRMLAICTYSLDECGASEVIDVVRNHQFALIKRRGEWELIESSEFKRVKEALRESEAKYRNLINNSNDLIITADENANWTFMSPSVKRILGYEPTEMVGRSAFDFMVPEDVASTREAHNRVVREGRRFWEYENRWISKDGRIVTLAWNVVALRNMQGKIIGTQGLGRDITEKKKAEEKLRFLKEFNERIIDSIGDALLVIDPNDYTIISANEAASKQLKLRKEDLIGKTCYETTHHRSTPCKPPNHICPIQEILKTGKAVAVEHTHFDKDNNEIYVEVSASPVKNQEGNIVQVVHLARDITERKKAEEALRESEEKFRKIFDSANDSMIYLDRSGKILDVNKKAVEVFGGSKKELLGKHFTRVGIFSLREMPTLMRNFANILTGKKITINISIKNKKGQEMPLECSASVMKTGDKFAGIMVIARDVTERKKAEEQLRESEERYRTLFESAREGIITADSDGRILSANPAAAAILGYKSTEEMAGIPVIGLYVDLEQRKALFKELAEKGYVEGFEVTVKKKDGTHAYVQVTVTMHLDREGNILRSEAIIRDITERKQMEKKLEKYSQHLEEMVEKRTRQLKEAQEQLLRSEKLAAIGEVATMVGHDLRNPLQSIENATYYLNNELPRLHPSTPIPQKTMEMLQVLNKSVDYADRIIRDLQDFSAPKKPTLKKTNINAIVEETLSQVEAPENVKLITKLGHLPEIKVDKDMIKRAFLNLAINGIQAMENGGRLTISTKETKGFVEVSFEDTGVGMTKENMKNLFTPFFTTKAQGMGMGLAICRKLVDAHGGNIEVESQEGKGTTFKVKLPIQQGNGGENP